MRNQTKWLTLGMALVAVVACSKSSGNGATSGGAGDTGDIVGTAGTGTGGSGGTVKGYCTDSCTKAHECDKTIDVKTCSNGCSNNLAAGGPKLRGDFVDNITSCYGDQDCVAVLNSQALPKCTGEAVAVLAPSKTGTTFCTEYQDAVEKCNGSFDKAACYDNAKIFNDASLKDAEGCLTKACADIVNCVTATLGEIPGITDVVNGNGGSGPVGTAGTGATPGTAGTGAVPGTGGTGAGGTGSGTAGTGNEAGAGTAGGTSCDSANYVSTCASATSINACVGSKVTPQTCKAYFGSIGIDSNACAAGKCNVVGPLDQACWDGVANLCQCKTVACTDAETAQFYVNCYRDLPAGMGFQDAIHCMSNAASCDAVSACIPQ